MFVYASGDGRRRDLEVLYYPSMHIRELAWIRSQLFYFDKIRTIFPAHRLPETESRDEAILCERGILQRETPASHLAAVERASRGMVLLLEAARTGQISPHFRQHAVYSETSTELLKRLRSLGAPERGEALRI